MEAQRLRSFVQTLDRRLLWSVRRMAAKPCRLGGFAAALLGGAAGGRLSRRAADAGPKLIAGVPVLNYHSAYANVGASLDETSAEEEWVVMAKPGVTDMEIEEMCRVAVHGCNLSGRPSHGGVPFFEMRGTQADLEAVIRKGNGAVKYIEIDQMVSAIPEMEASMDSTDLWGLQRVGAHKRSSEGAGVTVFLTDTGVRTTHADFGGRAVPTLDLTGGEVHECDGDLGCAGDVQGHGTHCAGSAAGTSYGVAPASTIRSVKVLGDDGRGSFSWSYAALDWMAASDIRPAVASMSLGGMGTQAAMKDAIDAASAAGVTVVVAGGNSRRDACNYSPAFVPSAITVGSTDSSDARSSFSNYGACVNLWAPGSGILSAGHLSDTATDTLSGTSMACPHVAGGAMLVLERNPSFSSDQVLAALLAKGSTDYISDLKTGDTNVMLYVGSDGPPPNGGVLPPTPAPPPQCGEPRGSGPDSSGHCRCNSFLYCHNGGRFGGCPRFEGTSSRYFHPSCSTCKCCPAEGCR